jgi:hypothetical protein
MSPNPIIIAGHGQINSTKQSFREIGGKYPHVVCPDRDTEWMTSHHLIIEALNQSLRLIGYATKLTAFCSLAKDHWRGEQENKES